MFNSTNPKKTTCNRKGSRFLTLLLVLTAYFATAQPAGFSDQLLMGGWNQAVGIAFDESNKMYVWEKGGKVWIVENGVKQSTPLIDISEEVGNWRDFGLVGFALDPHFESNGHIYLCYTVDRHHLLHFGTAQYNPNTNEYFNATIGRVTRYTAEASTNFTTVDYSSRQVLVGETKETGIPSLHESHGIGQLVFGEDHTLLVCAGDGASYGSVDEGSASETYYAQALADGIISSAENIGAYRSQSLNSLDGKILRIDPDTGDGVPTNPFYNSSQPRSPQSRVWARGVRNPYRMVHKPETGSHFESDGDPGVFFFGDVGWGTREELDVVSQGGQNFGWPKYEGMTYQPGYNNSTYTPSSHERPKVDWRTGTPRALVNGTIYNVGSAQVPGPSFNGNAATGGVWYIGDDFPEEYQNTYFHADYGAGWIRNFTFDDNHNPVEVNNFLSNIGAVVFVNTSPVEGGLFYIRYPDQLRRVTYNNNGNNDPVAIASVNQSYGAGPFMAQFVGNESYDPDNNPLTFSWDFGDGNTSNEINPKHTYTPSGNGPVGYTATLTLSDNNGGSDQKTVQISINNTPPVIVSTSIDNQNTFNPATTTNLSLSATVTDTEHSLAQLSYQWQTYLMHNNHGHEETATSNPTGTAVLTPIGCDGATYWYRIVLTVTDPAGLSAVFEKNIYPDCSGTSQSITFSAIPDQLVSNGSFALSVSASSGLPVNTFVIDGPAIASNNQITLSGLPGQVTVRAIQSGNSTYAPALPIEQSFFVHPTNIQSQSITFPTIQDKTTAAPPFSLNASASSGLPVGYTILSGPAIVSGNTLTLTGATGTVTVRACQTGNMQFYPASFVDRSFEVTGVGCTDNDNDGICADTDCDDNNPAIPATPGAACDDGNPNTTNDVIQADGCTCQGTTSNTDCNNIVMTAGPSSITVSGLTAPVVQVQVFSPTWATVFSCSGNCNPTETVTGLSAGAHYVKVRFYTANWGFVCEVNEYVTVGGGCTDNDNDGICAPADCDDNDPAVPTTPGTACNDGDPNTTNDVIEADGCSCAGTPVGCTDNDNDGVCADVDCDDNNPAVPTTPGTSCNDGNPNTNNDVIQADGCTCQGTTPTGDCSSVNITGGPSSITVTGLDAAITQVQIFNPSWASVLNCSGNCDATETASGLTPGTYYVKVRFYTEFWSFICEVDAYVEVGNSCVDNDNDGVCAPADCDDNNPALPASPGTTCNDGDPNTTNDVIQSDGCTCQGTPVGCTDNDNDGVCADTDCNDNDPTVPTTPGTSCDDGNANTNNDVILADGCTCQGSTTGGGTDVGCGVSYVSTATSTTISGLDAPHVILKLFSPTWATVYQCVDDCDNPLTISGLSDGTYHLSVDLYSANWVPTCNLLEDLVVGNGQGLVANETSEFLFFNVMKDGREVNLNWVTNTEYKNDYFLIERSLDGQSFEPLVQVQSEDNVMAERYYQQVDERPYKGVNYYRLQQVYADGTFRYSNTKAVEFLLDLDRFELFPNPAGEDIFVNLYDYRGMDARIQIYNALGQMVIQKQLDEIPAHAIRFDLSGYHNGLYTISVKVADRKRMTRQFVISHTN